MGSNPQKKNPTVTNGVAPDFIPDNSPAPDFIPDAQPVASHAPVNTEGYDWNPPQPNQPAPKKSLWEKLNTGLVTPDELQQSWLGAGMSQDELAQKRDAVHLNESPFHAQMRSFVEGAGHDLADVGSSMTSPVSIATAAAAKINKLKSVPKMLLNAAKGTLAGTGLINAEQGAENVGEGAPLGDIDRAIYYGLHLIPDSEAPKSTPEQIQKTLLGGSQLASAAPAIHATARGVTNAVKTVAPGAFGTGETAFLRALEPKGKNAVPNLRRAYQTVQGELTNAQPSSIEELRDYAHDARGNVINELNSRIALQGGNIAIDPRAIANAGRGAVNELMQMEAQYNQQNTGVLNAQGQPIMRTVRNSGPREAAIHSRANLIAENLSRNPQNLVYAEKMVQALNAEYKSFYRLSPDQRWQALHDQPQLIADFAIKDNLQSQLDNVVSQYGDLNRKYGAWKEIENGAQSKLDRMDTQQPNTHLARRALENSMAAVGGMLGLHGADGLATGFLGYKGGQALGDVAMEGLSSPDRMLRRAAKTPPTPISVPRLARGAQVGTAATGTDLAVSHAPTTKIANEQEIEDYAKVKGMDPNDVRQQLQKAGYTIQGTSSVPRMLSPLTTRK